MIVTFTKDDKIGTSSDCCLFLSFSSDNNCFIRASFDDDVVTVIKILILHTEGSIAIISDLLG